MAEIFNYLFSPMRIGSITVRNRIVSTAHATLLAKDYKPSDRHVDYHTERARGGVGLIITEGTVVHPTGLQRDNRILGYDPDVVPGFSRIADSVHSYGTKIFGQLWHCGHHMTSDFSKLPVWSASSVPCPVFRETPHAMTIEEIQAVIQGYARTAENFKEAGFDGVEIHSAHGYLPQQFLSPLTNSRNDRYGGDLESRFSFISETITAIRMAVGPEFVVGIRISADEFLNGGLTLDEMKQVATWLADSGRIDYVSVSVANYANYRFLGPDMQIPSGAFVPLAAAIKQTIDLPIIAVGRISDPVLAEKVLENGSADLVAMTRACLVDPEMPNKAKSGKLNEIRKCVGCVQECLKISIGRSVGCIQNPAVGQEKILGLQALKPASRKRKVVIVGGGPAGMEAARVASVRGHEVVLFEKQDRLGGQVNLAASLPSREELGDVGRYLIYQMNNLPINLKLGVAAVARDIFRENPDVVIVATGSNPSVPAIRGANARILVSYWDAIRNPEAIGDEVIVMDGGEGFWQLCGTVELLANQRKRVTVLTPLDYLGAGLHSASLHSYLERIEKKNVTVMPRSRVLRIEDDDVVIATGASARQVTLTGIDSIVAVVANEVNDSLIRELQGSVEEIYSIGDCVAPRRLDSAIREGYLVGLRI